MPSAPARHPHDVFPSEKARHLDTRFRRLLYRPGRLAARYVRPGDRVLDFGCGPGFFTREFAKRVGDGGRVFAVDLQEEMLHILRAKMEAGGLLSRITTHRCRSDTIALPDECRGTFDAAFAIFVVHEVPDPRRVFSEIGALVKPGGTLFFSEPPLVVSGREFEDELRYAEEAGFSVRERRLFFVNRAAVLVRK